MNNKEFLPNQRVSIVADANFTNTGLNGHKGVVVSAKGSFIDILVTSGKSLGKVVSLLSQNLKKEY